jgi:hypothetical protein
VDFLKLELFRIIVQYKIDYTKFRKSFHEFSGTGFFFEVTAGRERVKKWFTKNSRVISGLISGFFLFFIIKY